MNVCLSNSSSVGGCSEDSFKYYVYSATYVLLFPIALICNGGALVVFILQRSRRSSASCVVMTNLALSDFSFSLTLPLRLHYYFNGRVWNFSDWLCRLYVFCFYVNLYTSILFLTLLSVLRWLAVTRPLRHRALATPTKALLVCLGVWLFVGVASAPFLIQGRICRSGVYRCFDPPTSSLSKTVLIMNYVALLIGFLLPFLTIVLSYSRIVRRLNRRSSLHGAEGPSARLRQCNRRRSIHLVAMVMVTFVVCFLPYHVMRSVHLHATFAGWSCDVTAPLQKVVAVTLCMAASNSGINPVLYYYSTRRFRDNLREARTSLSGRRGSIATAISMNRRRNSPMSP
ncbi:cysteinyl leukotriene receptor 2 [Notothenia coriiceps]|uniref:Cysteinyl leukotriene receptor 2 n=1 Tax=Notothenia coriiceps TaxID=8208 RepID=A0A6I9P5H8_9TELE|nr:PREDICTED: cysteinyl leukotriene receptor 2-like [Notothenia coriiceps]